LARSKSKAAEVIDVADHAAIEKAGDAASELVLVQAQHESAVRAVATQLGYQLPADCTDPDLIQRDIAANMRRSVESCLEVGRGLMVLKTACGHGNFGVRLEVLGIDKHVAARFMQSAAKFSKLPSTATLTAIGNQTKLFEMLVLDDEQVEELELTGQTGELKLDDVATMSVKQLRAAVRELRATGEANDKVLAGKAAEVAKLERKLNTQRVAVTDYPGEFEGYIAQVQEAQRAIDQKLAALDVIRLEAMRIEPGEGEEELLNKARQMLAATMAQTIARTEELVQSVRLNFDRTLGCWLEA
jgi:hypothetical protein